MGNQVAKPVLGHDITDLSPFGGSVAAVLRQGLVKDDAQEALIDYLLEGTKPDPEAETMIQERAADWKLSFVHQPRLILAALLALPDEAVSRAAPIVGLSVPPTLHSVVELNSGRRQLDLTTNPMSTDDLLMCGTRWGWNKQDLVSAIAVGKPGFFQITHLLDWDSFVRLEVELILETAGSLSNRYGLWRALAEVSTEVVELYAAEILLDATSSDRDLRTAALTLSQSLPQSVAIQNLRRHFATASTAERKRIAPMLLAQLSDNMAVPPDFLGWVEDRRAHENSSIVLESLDRLKLSIRHLLEARNLPEVSFETVALSSEEWMDHNVIEGLPGYHVDVSLVTVEEARQLLDGTNGIRYPRFNTPVIAVINAAKGLNLNERLCPANLALLMLRLSDTFGRSGSHKFRLLSQKQALEPTFISAVGQARGIRDSAALIIVCSLWRDDAQRWTSANLVEWLRVQAISIARAIDTPSEHRVDRDCLIDLVLSVQKRPKIVQDAIVRIALKGRPEDRRRLSKAMDSAYTDDVVAYLDRGPAERIAAARWIAAHPTPAATEAVLAAARSEDDDLAMSAMLTALDSMDISLKEFISPEALRTTATKAMSKKSSFSKAIGWLDAAALPSLRWSSGEDVEDVVVTWFLHSAAKTKSSAPSALVRRHFAKMNTDDVRTFGEAVLLAWATHDLRLVSKATALENAQNQAVALYRDAQRDPLRLPEYAGLSEEQIAGLLLPRLENELAGNARTSQGLLAVVAAAGSPAVTERARSYIKTYRTKRPSQCKALIEMMTWMADPGAIQTVMAMANRFHPKSLQKEAASRVELLAQHHNWSIDDLADRSVPDGGFDRDGRLTFDFGSRTFSAHLGDDLGVALFDDATGKSIRSLPRGRADEDRDNIKALKTVLKNAKSDAAAALDFQPHRLRRAMATQRTWSAADFQQFVIEQPLMIRLASRLLWVADDAAGKEIVFRPLTDGTILTMADNELDLGDHPVRLAHGTLLSSDVERNAAEHLRDYEVDVLFPQLYRTAIEVAAGERLLDVVAGTTLSANKLAAQARSRGWQVADTNGSGSSVGVCARFPDQGLQAILAVEGGLHLGGYDYIDYDCTLSNLYVVELGTFDYGEHVAVDLSSLSPVLLSELVHEVQVIAVSDNP